jgi:hypothetical protein
MKEAKMADKKKKVFKRSNLVAPKRVAKKTAAAKPAKKAAKKTSRRAAVPSRAAHHAVFKNLAALSGQHNKPPVCYELLGGGGRLICFLQSDGSYAQCQPYTGPIHQPLCG